MEQAIYEFYDGDFTFSHVEYSKVHNGYTFRVRTDTTPEKRHIENTKNGNSLPLGNNRIIRPATKSEIEHWFGMFQRNFPLRKKSHTSIIVKIKEKGFASTDLLSEEEQSALLELGNLDVLMSHNFSFSTEKLVFITRKGNAVLTPAGLNLASLIGAEIS